MMIMFINCDCQWLQFNNSLVALPLNLTNYFICERSQKKIILWCIVYHKIWSVFHKNTFGNKLLYVERHAQRSYQLQTNRRCSRALSVVVELMGMTNPKLLAIAYERSSLTFYYSLMSLSLLVTIEDYKILFHLLFHIKILQPLV